MGRTMSHTQRAERNSKFSDGLLWCSDCKAYKPIGDFHNSSSENSNYGYVFYCRDCRKKKDKKYIKKNIEYSLGKYHSRQYKLMEMMGGAKCQRCGYESYVAIQFHHVDPDEKVETVTNLCQSKYFEPAIQEADKCALLCSNCHDELEAGVWIGEFEKADYGYRLKSHRLTGKEFPIKKHKIKMIPKQLDLI